MQTKITTPARLSMLKSSSLNVTHYTDIHRVKCISMTKLSCSSWKLSLGTGVIQKIPIDNCQWTDTKSKPDQTDAKSKSIVWGVYMIEVGMVEGRKALITVDGLREVKPRA